MREISISEIQGFSVGHSTNEEAGTGCTAILCKEGAVVGVDVRGGAPATRETDLINPKNMVEKVHCVMLAGGSAFGLAAADGGLEYLEEHQIGFDVGVGVVPVVPSACLFDLAVGDSKVRPDKAMGYEALCNTEKNQCLCGNVGAGTGACIGKLMGKERAMKSGLGIYAVQVGALQVGAVVAVNALGDVFDVTTGKPLAGLLNEEGTGLASTRETMYTMVEESWNVFKGNTTIGCIVTNARLSKAEASKIASMTHNGYARAICPVHTTADGDTVFVLSHGEVEAMVDLVGTLAADVMARAINVAVTHGKSAYGLKAAKDL